MLSIIVQTFIKFCGTIALAGGRTASRYFHSSFNVERKKDNTPATDADRAAEKKIRSLIQKKYPSHSIHGEEFGDTGKSDYKWIIDPIDATKNFARKIPFYGTLVALEHKGKIIAGAVYEPESRSLWSAEKGKGAFKNGKRIHVSKLNKLSKAMLLYGNPDKFDNKTDKATSKIGKLCYYVRGYGDYLGHMLVAEGKSELMIDPAVKPEDVAACKIIVEEAGGKFTDFKGRNTHLRGTGLSSNGILHGKAVSFFRK